MLQINFTDTREVPAACCYEFAHTFVKNAAAYATLWSLLASAILCRSALPDVKINRKSVFAVGVRPCAAGSS